MGRLIIAAVNWNPNPYFLQWGDSGIRWYGIFWGLAILLTYILGRIIFKKDRKEEKYIIEIFEFVFIGALIGARLGQVLFYDLSYYLLNPIQILQIWNGGLSSHGATIGVLLGSYLFCKKHQSFEWLWLLDRLSIQICLGAGLIRIGNLMNSELYGTESHCPWAFKFVQVDELFRHPVQLYEALLVWMIGAFLFFLYWNKKYYNGVLVSLFFTFAYSGRIGLEFFKESAATTQLYSIPIVLLGLFFSWRIYQVNQKKIIY